MEVRKTATYGTPHLFVYRHRSVIILVGVANCFAVLILTSVMYFLAKLGPISERTSDKRILDPLYIFEFPADKILVRMTAFRILAAADTPVF
jgi:hypothetical protein